MIAFVFVLELVDVPGSGGAPGSVGGGARARRALGRGLAAAAAARAAAGAGAARVAAPLRARVRVHVIAGDDVYAHVARGPRRLGARPPRERYRRLAEAVVEQVHVSVTEVAVRHAVQEVVETGLAEGEPRQVVEQSGGHPLRRPKAQDHAERKPKHLDIGIMEPSLA